MTDADEIWNRMRAVYAGFLARDPTAVDAILDADVTIWDSEEFTLVRGLDALQQLRERRPAPADGAASVMELDAVDPVVNVWEDTALLRHILHVRLSDGSAQTVRNTSVWRRRDGRWYAVHNHEDVAARP